MKKILSILIVTVVFIGMQACVSKRETTARVTVVKPTEPTVDEKRAILEVQRAASAERRRIEFDERYKAAPYDTSSTGSLVYNKAEVDPAYYGGEQALTEYLRENLVYPKEAESQGLEATVFVDFVILANGSVKDAYVLQAPGEAAINESLKDEAVRVIKDMPNWIPGRQNGEAVDVRYSLPITFRIG